MRDFFIRQDLQKTGIPERTIRVLEKASLLIEALERITASEGAIQDANDATDALNEAIEDANITLATLDARLDEQENGNGPYVKKIGDVMTGALDVHALVQCDSLRVDQAPTAATPVQSHYVTVNFNGTDYKVLLAT